MSSAWTIPSPATGCRAITSPALHHAAYALIIAGELVTGVLLAYGALGLWRARYASAARFAAAKKPVVLGAAASFLVWFVGFMVVGGAEEPRPT